jgi:hypothetical protein
LNDKEKTDHMTKQAPTERLMGGGWQFFMNKYFCDIDRNEECHTFCLQPLPAQLTLYVSRRVSGYHADDQFGGIDYDYDFCNVNL